MFLSISTEKIHYITKVCLKTWKRYSELDVGGVCSEKATQMHWENSIQMPPATDDGVLPAKPLLTENILSQNYIKYT